ncbi:hypothetical protein RC1_2821 [Rhodospirillum centenum SW]|uniref:Uncharacterized protein n=1 Tax=Rhodospirillum centenum (strain ATCC 51521 / SW) TaxID=414684 RepID=B6IV69_RHOCS|nr:hypothetical protein RC1_2821 [Rhodospirillum centenum SW]
MTARADRADPALLDFLDAAGADLDDRRRSAPRSAGWTRGA